MDWTFIASLLGPALTAYIIYKLERRAKLITFFNPAAFHSIPTQGNEFTIVQAHSIVIKNVGRKTATNINVRHIGLRPASYNIWPDKKHKFAEIESGRFDIAIDRLVPQEQITISYLFFVQVPIDKYHDRIVHDDGVATRVPVLPTPQITKKAQKVLFALLLIGLGSISWLAIKGIMLVLVKCCGVQ